MGQAKKTSEMLLDKVLQIDADRELDQLIFILKATVQEQIRSTGVTGMELLRLAIGGRTAQLRKQVVRRMARGKARELLALYKQGNLDLGGQTDTPEPLKEVS